MPLPRQQAAAMAAMVASAGVAGLGTARPLQRAFSSQPQRKLRTVIVRAEDAKVTREFKEGDEKATAAKGDGALYADQIKAPPPPSLYPRPFPCHARSSEAASPLSGSESRNVNQEHI